MYQAEPTSATIAPWVLSACRITRTGLGKRVMFTDDFSRNQAPIGGSELEVALPTRWLAGQMKAARTRGTVTRSAWSIFPAATSSYLTSGASIDSPAASAEVHPVGRSLSPR